MTKRILKHPYAITSILFSFLLMAALVLQWRPEHLAYLLQMYFIVTIGIKLDDISRQLRSTREKLPEVLDDAKTIINQLNDITGKLSTINATLDKRSPTPEVK